MQASAVKCFGETPNKKNRVAMMAEPLDAGLGERVQKG
jgi:U5 small nuclear ribonucleoprotein component